MIKPITFSNKEHVVVMFPLSVYDKLKDRLMPIFDEEDPKAVAKYRDVLNEMKDIAVEQFSEPLLEFLNGLHDRWLEDDSDHDGDSDGDCDGDHIIFSPKNVRHSGRYPFGEAEKLNNMRATYTEAQNG